MRRNAEELKMAADFHMKMKEKHLSSSQFSDLIEITPDLKLHRPPNWV